MRYLKTSVGSDTAVTMKIPGVKAIVRLVGQLSGKTAVAKRFSGNKYLTLQNYRIHFVSNHELLSPTTKSAVHFSAISALPNVGTRAISQPPGRRSRKNVGAVEAAPPRSPSR